MLYMEHGNSTEPCLCLFLSFYKRSVQTFQGDCYSKWSSQGEIRRERFGLFKNKINQIKTSRRIYVHVYCVLGNSQPERRPTFKRGRKAFIVLA